MGYTSKGDVEWFLPNTKRRFAYSTISTRDLIDVLSETYLTVNDVYQNINYDDESKDIVMHFIENGYGNFIMYDLLNINKDRTYRKVMEDGTIKEIPAKELKNNLDIKKDDVEFVL